MVLAMLGGLAAGTWYSLTPYGDGCSWRVGGELPAVLADECQPWRMVWVRV